MDLMAFSECRSRLDQKGRIAASTSIQLPKVNCHSSWGGTDRIPAKNAISHSVPPQSVTEFDNEEEEETHNLPESS